MSDKPERPGQSLMTRNHEVIQHWAEERGVRPATVAGSEQHDGQLGVLRFTFPGEDWAGKLRPVAWQSWFDALDERELNFVYQETGSDGTRSNFFRLQHASREFV